MLEALPGQVQLNDKPRFELRQLASGETQIRATHGHTMSLAALPHADAHADANHATDEYSGSSRTGTDLSTRSLARRSAGAEEASLRESSANSATSASWGDARSRDEDGSTRGTRLEDHAFHSRVEIQRRMAEGWAEKDARSFEILCNFRRPLARALRAGDSRLAASTYAVTSALARALELLSARASRGPRGKRLCAPLLYRNLYGERGLLQDDPAWMSLSTPDQNGFRGLTSSSIVRAFCKPTSLVKGGFVVTSKDQGGVKGRQVAGWEPAPTSSEPPRRLLHWP